MASSYNFTFDNLSRIGDDVCGISERDIQNQQFGSYTTQNYFEKFCGLKQPVNFATQQPNVTLGAGYGVSDSCKINNDSNLRIKQTQTNPKCKNKFKRKTIQNCPLFRKRTS